MVFIPDSYLEKLIDAFMGIFKKKEKKHSNKELKLIGKKQNSAKVYDSNKVKLWRDAADKIQVQVK